MNNSTVISHKMKQTDTYGKTTFKQEKKIVYKTQC